MAHSDHRSYYISKPTTPTQSREPSIRSGASSSRSSTDTRSSTSRSMTEKYEKLRVPDNGHYILGRTTEKVKVINHGKKTYDPSAPRASDAVYEDYKRTHGPDRREREQRRK